MKLLLSIRDYLIVWFGAGSAIPAASLELCDWLKSEYPLLNNEELLIVSATLIRSLKGLHQVYPLQHSELNRAVQGLINDRYKK